MAGAEGVHDLLIYLQAELGKSPNRLVTAMQLTQRITFQNKQPRVGLDWHQTAAKTGWWHNGGTGGYARCARFDPTAQTPLVTLSTTAASIDELALALSRLLIR